MLPTLVVWRLGAAGHVGPFEGRLHPLNRLRRQRVSLIPISPFELR